MGDPADRETQVGPVTTPPQYKKILDYIAIGKSEGAKVVLGGGPANKERFGEGWFIEPTIFTEVHNRMRIAQEEIFGPVLSVIPFADEEEAVAIANDTIYGLAASVWTQSIRRANPITKQRIFEALGLLEQAITIDRHYRPALSWAAIYHLQLVRAGWAEEPETSRRKASGLARQALEAGENDSGILANAAFVLAFFGEDIGSMIGLVDRALALNPSFVRGWYLSGSLRLWAGQPDQAIEHVETSLRLSPRERMGVPLVVIGQAYFFKRQFDEAVSKLLLSIQDHPGSPPAYRTLAACYAHMGRLDEARAIVARLRAITPLVVPSDLPFRNPEDRESRGAERQATARRDSPPVRLARHRPGGAGQSCRLRARAPACRDVRANAGARSRRGARAARQHRHREGRRVTR
jgi:aldehyde dehydrogenase family protein/tetratricopeptide repeat protein